MLNYKLEATDWHAFGCAMLTSVAETPPFVDGQIAVIAVVNDHILVTSSVRDFAEGWGTAGAELDILGTRGLDAPCGRA